MLTAFKEGTRNLIFASRGVSAYCPECKEPLITKCGKLTTPHFAHKPHTECGKLYHDGMSEWHYNWQLKIENPTAGVNIEVPIQQEYLKRADVITKEGIVIEFQKSPLPIDERRLREYQYKNMMWVVHKDIKKSKTWLYHKSSTPILIDDPECDYLYLYNSLGVRINKRAFVFMIMNGDVAYPMEFFKYVYRKQKIRGNRRINNALPDHFLSEDGFLSNFILFDYFNKEVEKLLNKNDIFANF